MVEKVEDLGSAAWGQFEQDKLVHLAAKQMQCAARRKRKPRAALNPPNPVDKDQNFVGGFGVGSDFTWQVVGGFNWTRERKFLGMDVSGVIGYRALSVDYTEGGSSKFAYDNVLHGPLLGLRFSF